MSSKADFGHAIVFMGEKIGLSQDGLALAMGLKPATVSAWKKGGNLHPSSLRKVLEVLRCTEADINEVAEFHAEWRRRMNDRRHHPAAEIASPAPAPYGAHDDQERELGRIMVSLMRQLRAATEGRRDS